MKKYTLEEITDEFIGKKGSVKRKYFDQELKLELMGKTIKKVRQEKNQQDLT